MNEAKYLMKNYGDRGGCYPFKTIPGFKPKLTYIDVKFLFDSSRLGLFSSANILQRADVALRVVFFLFLPRF